MDFFSNLVAKVGGDDALNLINDQLTPLLLNSFKPRISEYVNTHVERTREELFQQLPDGVRNVLHDIIPGGLNNQRGLPEMTRGLFDDIVEQIRHKIDKILDETRQRVRDVVQEVTSSTSERVTRSVVEIAQNKLKLKSRAVQDSVPSGESSRALNFGSTGGSGDFIDNFINSSMEEVRPLVRGELKSVYDSIIHLVPQDVRKILVSLVPGLEDNQGSQNSEHTSQLPPNQQFNNGSQGSYPQTNQFNPNPQYNSGPQGGYYQNNQSNPNQPYNNGPQGGYIQNNQHYNNLPQGGYNQQYNNGPQGGYNQFNANPQYNYGPQGGYIPNNQFNPSPQSSYGSRGLPQEDEVRSRGFMSDLKNLAHQVKDTVKSELQVNSLGGSRGGPELLREFQTKALDKIIRITSELMNQLENKIMVTVSEELRTVAKSKLTNKLAL